MNTTPVAEIRCKTERARQCQVATIGHVEPNATAIRSNHKRLGVAFYVGVRFGRLVVVGSVRHSEKDIERAVCKCDCGSSHEVRLAALTSGNTRSCGCLRRDVSKIVGGWKRTHGMTKTASFSIWMRMIRRCHEPSDSNYPGWGGRGIHVCDRWRASFENFYADMGDRPKGLSLDRIDNNGPYSPENCRWATWHEQARNRRSTRYGTAFGETKSATEWLEDPRCAVNRTTLFARLEDGWDFETAITKPPKADRRRLKDGLTRYTLEAKP